MKTTILTLVTIFLVGCSQSGYRQFYTPYVDAKILPDIELLTEGQEPQLYGTSNLDRDILTLRSKMYIPIGYSSFNGSYEDTKNATEQAKRIGATVVLVNSQYTNTLTTTSTLLIPDNKITYYSGTVNGNTTYNNSYGDYIGNSNSSATYSGTSTTYGTKSVPITSHQQRYDQKAIYLVKSTKKPKFGVALNNLTPNQREKLERNTGAYINVVMEDSPAFYANVIPGDVLIAVDDQRVLNTKQAMHLMNSVNPKKLSSTLTVIRKGKEKIINIQF